nr:iron-containing redox enzyme family protein [Rickettsia conorii]
MWENLLILLYKFTQKNIIITLQLSHVILSAIHSKCSDIQARQRLLGNLIEEQGEENHPELWKRFAKGLGCLRNQRTSEPKLDLTQKLVQGY